MESRGTERANDVGTQPSTTAERVERLGYAGFFRVPEHEANLEGLWSEPGAPRQLEELVRNASAPVRARFLASEILLARDFTFLSRVDRDALAAIYAQAMRDNATGMMSDWGFRSGFDDPGPVGGHLAMLGEPVVPQLAKLLDDGTPVPYVAGADVLHDGYDGYRIKDLAALHLIRIRQLQVSLSRDPAQRDAAITMVKGSLAAE